MTRFSEMLEYRMNLDIGEAEGQATLVLENVGDDFVSSWRGRQGWYVRENVPKARELSSSSPLSTINTRAPVSS